MSVRSLKNSSIRGSQEVASRIVLSDSAPTNPKNGDRWFDTTSGKTYLWYEDVDSGQWIDFGAGRGLTGPQGPPGFSAITISTSLPTSGDGNNGDLWIFYS